MFFLPDASLWRWRAAFIMHEGHTYARQPPLLPAFVLNRMASVVANRCSLQRPAGVRTPGHILVPFAVMHTRMHSRILMLQLPAAAFARTFRPPLSRQANIVHPSTPYYVFVPLFVKEIRHPSNSCRSHIHKGFTVPSSDTVGLSHFIQKRAWHVELSSSSTCF